MKEGDQLGHDTLFIFLNSARIFRIIIIGCGYIISTTRAALPALAELGLLSDECRPISLDLMIVRFGLLSLWRAGPSRWHFPPLAHHHFTFNWNFCCCYFFLFIFWLYTHTQRPCKETKKATSIFSLSLSTIPRSSKHRKRKARRLCVCVCTWDDGYAALIADDRTGGRQKRVKSERFLKKCLYKKKNYKILGDPEAIERRRRHFHLVNYEFLSVFSFST